MSFSRSSKNAPVRQMSTLASNGCSLQSESVQRGLPSTDPPGRFPGRRQRLYLKKKRRKEISIKAIHHKSPNRLHGANSLFLLSKQNAWRVLVILGPQKRRRAIRWQTSTKGSLKHQTQKPRLPEYRKRQFVLTSEWKRLNYDPLSQRYLLQQSADQKLNSKKA